ncbi:MAG: bifunctional alpha,alpha-trehalose-phosphate synthase (UDP-forming)/trehalose-phosphatase [Bdellovibrionota bacterium]
MVSNRLPYTHDKKTGKVVRGTGGLVSALLAYKPEYPMVWVGSETDPESAAAMKEMSDTFTSVPVMLENNLYNKYYDELCNNVLWPLFHYEGDLVLFTRDAWQAYEKVNKIFAEQIAKIATPDDMIWIHDFHLMLLPQYLKKINPAFKIGFFLHIPFPSSEIFRQLPVREDILKALLHADQIGFHEYSYLRHFTVSLKAQLGVNSTVFNADYEGHRVKLGVYPISIDPADIKERAFTTSVDEIISKYKKNVNEEHVILGVDRLDYSKGVELKLEGLRRALKKYPELRGRLTLIQVAVPTRTRVPAYARLKKRVDQLVGTINGEFGKPDYMPVRYIFSSVSDSELFALYRMSDTLLVTSKRDGMNLVCMEYILAQEANRAGTVILSEFAGAASLLSEATIINPWDVDSTADAIKVAFDRSPEERTEVHKSLFSTLSRYSASEWGKSFLKDLNSVKAQIPTIPITDLNYRSWPADISKNLDGPTVHLILDYDGTLTPIKGKPEEVHLDAATRYILERICERPDVQVCIVSGRMRSYLWKEFEGIPVQIAAEHGAFYRKSESDQWTNLMSSDLKTWYRVAERVMSDYAERVPHAFIEKKEAAVTWHYRMSPPGFADYQGKKLAEELEVGLANLPVNILLGSKVVEARANECNKGDFFRWYSKRYMNPGDRVLCFGDDRTDEDIFKACQSRGVTMKVGPGPTMAQYRLPSQGSVNEFLLQFLDYLKKKNK